MNNPEKLEELIRYAKPRLQEEFGVDKIGYFGSFANGDYSEQSDVDILVHFSRAVGWKFFELKEYLELILGRNVDLVTERSIKMRWKDRIIKEVKFV